jgi:hypothetical protein
MTVPAGTWWVSATATIDSLSPNPVTVLGSGVCRIRSGISVTLDQVSWRLDGLQDAAGVMDISLTTVHTEAGPWTANLTCYNTMDNNMVAIHNVVLTAVQVSETASPLVKSTTAGPVGIPAGSTYHTLASLNLAKGRWLIVGKTSISNSSSAGSSNTICRLKLSSTDQDQTGLGLTSLNTVGSQGEVALQVAHVFGSAGTAKLACTSSRDASADRIQLVALKVGKLTRKEFGGGTSTSGTGTPRVISGYRAGSTAVSAGFYDTVASLPLPAGKWLVTAKAWLSDGTGTKVDCSLSADFQTTADFSYGGSGAGSTGLYLQTWADTASPSNALLECKAATAGPALKYVRITALKASSMTTTSP